MEENEVTSETPAIPAWRDWQVPVADRVTALLEDYERGVREFYGAKLENANLRSANLYGANLEGANLEGANLYGANLRSANLRSANLEGANLRSANLRSANLEGANLRSANLIGANLEGANLRSANLEGANLYGANLRSAKLEGANLYGANLYGANLYGAKLENANLEGANLEESNFPGAYADFRTKCRARPNELPGLRAALVEGRINGSAYVGECACFVGTLANVAGCFYRNLAGIVPDSSSPVERLFLAIKKGDTPETNPVSKMVVKWLDEVIAEVQAHQRVAELEAALNDIRDVLAQALPNADLVRYITDALSKLK